MAWEWSHSPEAYEKARKNISRRSIKWLAECYAEFQCKEVKGDECPYSNGQYQEFFKQAKLLDKDVLIETVWEKAEKLRTCDNGGFSLWICPEGCHTVKC